jgi:hypothetical protein
MISIGKLRIGQGMNNDLETQGGIMGDGDSGALLTLALQRQQP